MQNMQKFLNFHKQKVDKSDIPGGWPPEASTIEELVDEYRKVSTDLSKCISNCLPSLGISDVDKRIKKIPESKVGTMFMDAGDKFQSTKPELRTVYRDIGEATTQLAVNRRDFEVGVEEKIVNHLKKLADDELPDIQKERKALSKSCSELRTVTERLENADPMKQPAEKIQQMRNAHEELEQRTIQQKDQTLKLLFQFDARCRENSLHILEYLTLLQDYHTRCCEILQTQIPKLQEHIQKSMVSPVFRTPLQQHLQESNSEIAYVLEICIKALNKESALKEEGLFRTAGSKTKVDILTHALDARCAGSLIHDCEYSVIADALKQYFRFMEEPLLLSSLFNDWMHAMQNPTQEDCLRELWNVMHRLPLQNRTNLRYLIKFLAKVSTFSEYNRMTPANLGIVFGPNLLKPNNANGAFGMLSTGVQSAIVELMITHADWFFPQSADMFSEFTKETDSNSNLAPRGVPVQSSYVNMGLESGNGPPAEESANDASPSTGRKHSGLSSSKSFSPSSGTMPRRKAPAPLPPTSPNNRSTAPASADDAPSHAKSMPNVLAPPGGSVANLHASEDASGDGLVSLNTAEGTVKLKSSTMPSRPVSLPPKPPLVAEAPSKAPPPRPKKPSFTPPAPPADVASIPAPIEEPPSRPVHPPDLKPRSISSVSEAEAPESTHF